MTADGLAPPPAAADVTAAGWLGRLDADFAVRGGRTVMARSAHQGPLRLQKLLYPERSDSAQAILLHPPGGVVQGDRLIYRLTLDAGARVLFTTPGAGKFYGRGTQSAVVSVKLRVVAQAAAEWFPQETILFDGARVCSGVEVEIETGGQFSGWEILCFGRAAAGERFVRGRWQQHLHVTIDGRPVWFEQCDMPGGDARLDTVCGLASQPVCGTFIVAGYGGVPLPLEALRAEAVAAPAQAGVSALPDVLVARYLGDSAEVARGYFSRLWQLIKPALQGREFVPPRIWST